MDAETNVTVPSGEPRGRFIDAPVWPWTAAGWTLAITAVLLFVIAWIVGVKP